MGEVLYKVRGRRPGWVGAGTPMLRHAQRRPLRGGWALALPNCAWAPLPPPTPHQVSVLHRDLASIRSWNSVGLV